jgi:large subunit ribosomal protein L22
MNKQTAKVRYLRIAPRKVRSVADLIKGLSVNEAEAQLMVTRKRAAQPILKLLRSAVANLKSNKRGEPENFYVESLRVDQGPMLKRSLPRARGMATPIQKKMSHVTLILAEKPGQKPRFKIVVPKKTKLPPELNKTGKKEKEPKKEEKKVSTPKKPGFFHRMFSRKSGFSK